VLGGQHKCKVTFSPSPLAWMLKYALYVHMTGFDSL
jgi:hypothetical protein